MGLLGGIFTYAREIEIVDRNPVNGVRKATDHVKDRRLSDDEYRLLGHLLRRLADDEQLGTAADMVWALALTGRRRGEIINLTWLEVDGENSCLRLHDSKEGVSVRPIGLPVLELLDRRRPIVAIGPVFLGTRESRPLIGFPKHWRKILAGTALSAITPHVLRHSFASLANDLGFTESTVAALLGHARGTVTSRYIHAVDSALIMAADTIAAYVHGLLDGSELRRTSYALDRASRKAAIKQLFPSQ